MWYFFNFSKLFGKFCNNIIKMVTIKKVKPTMDNMITALAENLSDIEIIEITNITTHNKNISGAFIYQERG